MTARDLLDLAWGNLRRQRLRVFFTTAGVVIAIATFVALLSFAAGSQKWVRETFTQLGLLTAVNVYPREAEPAAGAPRPPALDATAVSRLARLPGVRLAFPFVDFEVAAAAGDTTITARARALPQDAFQMQLYRGLLADHAFSGPDAHEVIVTPEFLRLAGIAHADSLVGRPLVVSLRVASLDSALLNVVGQGGRALVERLRAVQVDSLREAGYRRRLLRRELGEGAGRFVSGLFTRQLTVAETLTVIGVGADQPQHNLRLAPVVLPEGAARRLSAAGLNLSTDPAALLTGLRTGSLFAAAGADSGAAYPQVTLELAPLARHEAVVDSVEALGYRAFSFAAQFKEIQRFHLYFYAGMGVVGLLALLTAALGIVNTLVMSVSERRKEIGVIKALGADERDIRHLFLIESAVIGAAGAAAGIALGWLGTRVVSLVLKAYMAREQMPLYEPFDLPVWLVALAMAFGIGVSVLAGTFPAARAARVDPVEALRGE